MYAFGTMMAVGMLFATFAIGKELWAFIRNPHPIIIPAPTLSWLLPISMIILCIALFLALKVLYEKLSAQWGFGRAFLIGVLGGAGTGAILGLLLGLDPNSGLHVTPLLSLLMGAAVWGGFAFIILSGWGIILLAIRYAPVFRATGLGQLILRLKKDACPSVIEITD